MNIKITREIIYRLHHVSEAQGIAHSQLRSLQQRPPPPGIARAACVLGQSSGPHMETSWGRAQASQPAAVLDPLPKPGALSWPTSLSSSFSLGATPPRHSQVYLEIACVCVRGRGHQLMPATGKSWHMVEILDDSHPSSFNVKGAKRLSSLVTGRNCLPSVCSH